MIIDSSESEPNGWGWLHVKSLKRERLHHTCLSSPKVFIRKGKLRPKTRLCICWRLWSVFTTSYISPSVTINNLLSNGSKDRWHTFTVNKGNVAYSLPENSNPKHVPSHFSPSNFSIFFLEKKLLSSILWFLQWNHQPQLKILQS